MDIKQKAPFVLRQRMCHIVSLISIIGFILDASCAVSEERGYAYLCGRTYERTNTWNGCTRYATLSGTSFQVWKCPQDDCVTAVNASRYFVRYRLVKQRPVSYIKAPIPDESENPANDVKKLRLCNVILVNLSLRLKENLVLVEGDVTFREWRQGSCRLLLKTLIPRRTCIAYLLLFLKTVILS